MSSNRLHSFHGIVIGLMPIGFFVLACFLILQAEYWIALVLLAVCAVFWLILAGDKMKNNGRVN